MSEPKPKKAQVLEVRLATPDDSVAIAEVLRDAFTVYRKHYTEDAFAVVTPGRDEILGRFEEGPMWVAEMEGEVVGTVSLTTGPEGLYVRSMAVAPTAQGRGIGHLLLEAIHEYAEATQFERIFLYTTYFVPGAKEMYAKHGYKWVRDTTADEWYGTPGLEMDKRVERKTQNAIGS
ncbi:MAG: GNAT family N-acetyltransferase [bacterium]|nr:GNAT family N-acetyltransferase [bacterium]